MELSGLNGFQGRVVVSTVISIVILIKTGFSCVAKRLSASRNTLCEVSTMISHVPYLYSCQLDGLAVGCVCCELQVPTPSDMLHIWPTNYCTSFEGIF